MQDNLITVLEAAAKVVEQQNDPGTYTATNGVKFRLKRVPRTTMNQVMEKSEVPKPPEIWIEEKGRSEPNFNDPVYLKAVEAYDVNSGIEFMMALVLLGSDLVEVPDDVEKPESTDWSEILQYIGIEVPEKGKARYALWVRNVVLNDEDNLVNMAAAISHFNGWIKVAEVQKVEESFRDNTARDSDNRVPPPAPDTGRYSD